MNGIETFEQLNDLYIGILASDAHHEGAAGNIRDAVWASLQGDIRTNISEGLVDGAAYWMLGHHMQESKRMIGVLGVGCEIDTVLKAAEIPSSQAVGTSDEFGSEHSVATP